MKITYKDLQNVRTESSGRKMVFCDGTFDLLHLAHIEHLKSIRALGDVLVVGVMSDEWVKMKKGNSRPVLSQEERCEMLDAIKYVDYSFVLYEEEFGQRVRTSTALEVLRPTIFVTTDSCWKEKTEALNELNIEVRIVPPTPSATLMSTSKIIEKILKSNNV